MKDPMLFDAGPMPHPKYDTLKVHLNNGIGKAWTCYTAGMTVETPEGYTFYVGWYANLQCIVIQPHPDMMLKYPVPYMIATDQNLGHHFLIGLP